jgi:hypothetical protein
MRGPDPRVGTRPRDALNGVAGRRGIRTRSVRVGRARPGRAARGTRGQSLAKEWVGSNGVRKERLQLPVATTTEPGDYHPAHHEVWIARREKNGPEFAPRYRYVMARGKTLFT